MRHNPSLRLYLMKTALFFLLVGGFVGTYARQGMWIPAKINDKAKDMKALGLELPLDQLYNEKGTGLNNAVVLFGRGCTGELISDKGLVLTNHHCGYGSVQALSNTDHDYFATGFWAMNMNQELPCPGLTVTFVRAMENVTNNITSNLSDTMTLSDRDTIIARRIRNLEKGYKYKTNLDATIKPYFSGNQYWVILTETYRDIRLVGFPPNGIGFFGGDSDNWMWPRHNGDFSFFRVYADKNGKPADYASTNTPYKPKRFFTINTKGYHEDDFTMVYGFPGTTVEYISSYQLNQVMNISDPIRIEARTRKLAAWGKSMEQSREIFLKYTQKRQGLANGWKKWQGEVIGLNNNDVLGKKRAYEQAFQEWASKDSSRNYATTILSRIQANTGFTDSLLKGDEYIRETVLGVELIQNGALLDQMLMQMRKGGAVNDARMQNAANAFYKNYDANTDKEVFKALMPLFFDKASKWIPKYYKTMYAAHGSDFDQWANDIYTISMVASEEKMKTFMNAADSNTIKADPAWQLYDAIHEMQIQKIGKNLYEFATRINNLNRQYLKYRMQKDGDTAYYSDANLTLRVAYGKVKGVDPSGPAQYSYQTNIDEIMAKENPSVDEFKVPEKLKQLWTAKDYGKWGVNGTVPVAFTAENHTTGGNSGSPVLNAKGELIGINFDRAWDGTMSDYYFDPNVCRNISVDIRYTLFIIEKFGGAGWLLKEMKLK